MIKKSTEQHEFIIIIIIIIITIVYHPFSMLVGRFTPIKLLQLVLSNAHSFFSPMFTYQMNIKHLEGVLLNSITILEYNVD